MENKKINTFNYEEFIVDYLDGILSPLEVAELFLFFENHPELKENIDELKRMIPEADTEDVFGFKEVLKIDHDIDGRQISVENYLYYFTAVVEGDLTNKGIEAVERFILQNPETRRELELMKQTKVYPPALITFPHSSRLKRRTGLIKPMYMQWAAIAAALLILFSVYLKLNPESEKSINQTLGGYEIPLRETSLKQQNQESASLEKETQETQLVTPEILKKDFSATNEKRSETPPKKTMPVEKVQPIQAVPALMPSINQPPPITGVKRTEYTSLYEDIRLSQEMMLAFGEDEQSTGDDYQQIQAIKLGRRFNQYLRSGTQVASQVSGSMSGWLLADLGVKGFNLLTNNELKLVREVNRDGTTGNVSIENEGSSYLLRKASL